MIMLVSASFVGCIEDSTEDTLIEDNTVDETTQEEDTNDQDVNDSEEVSEDDELITPVGNSTNMAPYVDAGTWNDDQWGEHIIYDGDYDDHDDYDNTSFSVFVHWSALDYDGTIENAGFDLDLDQTIDVFVNEDSGAFVKDQTSVNGALTLVNNASNTPEVTWSLDSIRQENGCAINLHTSFMFIAEDDDGASSSEIIHYVHDRNIEYGMMGYYIDLGVFGLTENHYDMFNATDCADGPEIPVEVEFHNPEFYDGKATYQLRNINRLVYLTDVNFFLKDDTGTTYAGGNGFGEVAMQFQGGIEMGIETSYSWYGENTDLVTRAQTIAADDGSDYPVHFSTNGGDYHLLSSGNHFYVYGTGSNHNGPAETGWTLELVFEPTGDIIASLPLTF